MVRKRLAPVKPNGHTLAEQRDQIALDYTLALNALSSRRSQQMESLRAQAEERHAAVLEHIAHLEDEARVLADLV